MDFWGFVNKKAIYWSVFKNGRTTFFLPNHTKYLQLMALAAASSSALSPLFLLSGSMRVCARSYAVYLLVGAEIWAKLISPVMCSRQGWGSKPGSIKDPVPLFSNLPLFSNPKINNVWAYRYHYRVSSFLFSPVGPVTCVSRVTSLAFKSNQSNLCSVSTNVFEWKL